MRSGSTTAVLTQLAAAAVRLRVRPVAARGLLPAPTDRMIRVMARGLHGGVSLLSRGLAGSGPAWAQARGEDAATAEGDSGWFESQPAGTAPPAASQGLAPSP